MSPRTILAAIIAVALGAATAATAADDRAGCGTRTLAVCTRERVAALRTLSATLKQAAAQKPPSTADAKQLEALARYDRWLTRQSERAAELAGEGQAALFASTKQMQEMQMSFNLQYLQLQSQMQHEKRSYTAISNIMKTKHDTVKNSISNVR
jgi:hypothetical protein